VALSDGIAATRELARVAPQVAMLVLTMQDDIARADRSEAIVRARDAGLGRG
jgi:DNA-binding NarL/FixJ family response regulator